MDLVALGDLCYVVLQTLADDVGLQQYRKQQ